MLQSAGDGRVSPLPVRDEAGRAGREGLRGGVGRLQPQLPPVLHEPLDQAEQPLPALPAGVDRAEAGQVESGRTNEEDRSKDQKRPQRPIKATKRP